MGAFTTPARTAWLHPAQPRLWAGVLQPLTIDAEAKPENARYSARFKFVGKYRDATFSGNALTGEVVSFQETGVPFPLKANLIAGTTELDVEGTVTDAANLSGIDVGLHIAGQTMANLYPFLLLPLPASPPYDLRGHLILKGNEYTLENLDGKIGSSDVQGRAAYVKREPRPLLLNSLPARSHGIRGLIQASLHRIQYVFMLPAGDSPVITGCALSLYGTLRTSTTNCLPHGLQNENKSINVLTQSRSSPVNQISKLPARNLTLKLQTRLICLRQLWGSQFAKSSVSC
jgi:hypothetical protein